MKFEIDIRAEAVLPAACQELIAFAGDERVITFTGPMGAGKTTLIKQLCRTLGSRDSFSSPTYAIVNEYAAPGGPIYHFDLYRIREQNELFDLGFEEYLASGRYCFIEWPQVAEGLLPAGHVQAAITVEGRQRRLSARKC